MAATDTVAPAPAPKPAAVQPASVTSVTAGVVKSKAGAAPTASIHNIEDRASGEGILDATKKVVQQDETSRFRATVEQDLKQRVLHDPSVVSLSGNGGNSQAERSAAQDTFRQADKKWGTENEQFELAAKAQLRTVTADASPFEVERATKAKDDVLRDMKRAPVEQPHVTPVATTAQALEKASRSTGDDVLVAEQPRTLPPTPAMAVPASGRGEAPVGVNTPRKEATISPASSATPSAAVEGSAPAAQAAGKLTAAEAKVNSAGVTGANLVTPLKAAGPVRDAAFDSVPDRKPVRAEVTDSRPVTTLAVVPQAVSEAKPVALSRLQKAGLLPKDATFESVTGGAVSAPMQSSVTLVAAKPEVAQTVRVKPAQATVLGITQQSGIVINTLASRKSAEPVNASPAPQRRNNPSAKSVPTMSAGR